MYVILLGPPGAGKGTQAPYLVDYLRTPHVSSGDIFRENLSKGTALGLQAKEYMEQGRLVPDAITIAMIKERLSRLDTAKGAVLDGFPRTLDQAKALDEMLAEDARRVDKVLYISVDSEELLLRLSGRWTCGNCQAVYHEQNNPPKQAGKCDLCQGTLSQRKDDTLDTARNRLEVYFRETVPVIEYYQGRGILAEIQGEQDIERVQRDLRRALREGQ